MIIKVDNIQSQIFLGGADYNIKGSLKSKLYKFLSVKMHNYKRTDRYIAGGWDGSIYFINKHMQFKTGLLPYVLKFCLDLGYYIELEDLRTNVIQRPETLVTTLAPWELREYQKDAVQKCLHNFLFPWPEVYFPRGIIKAATNAGKNSIIMSIVSSLPDYNTLILVHRVELFKQLVDFANDCGLSPSRFNGRHKELGKFTIAMYKTLKSRSKKMKVIQYLNAVNCLIVDECHNASAKTYRELILSINAYAIFFASGTPLASEKDEKNMSVIEQSGKILYKISNQDLIDMKVSQKPTIYMFDYYVPAVSFSGYYAERDAAQYSLSKMDIIKNIGHTFHEDKILIIVEFVEQGEFILETLMKANILVDFVHGQDPNRTAKIDRFKAGVVNVLIATMIFKEGINVQFSYLINAFGGKSEITMKQIIGRLLRHDNEKDHCTYVDFIDSSEHLEEHTDTRLQIYTKEGFEVLACSSSGLIYKNKLNFFDK